jgi:cation diffusion facilitator family transporter
MPASISALGSPDLKAGDSDLVEDSVKLHAARSDVLAMAAAVVAGLAIMALKFYGYWITGSSAILSDALESIINVVAGAFALGSLILAAKPPDASHPYGHGKIEFFSAGFEGALIVLAAFGIFAEGMRQIINPQPLPQLQMGLLILLAAGLGNLALGTVLIRLGKRTRSFVVEADGWHLLADVYTSVGVLVGLALVYFTHYYRMDGIVACIVGINVIVMGVKIIRQAFEGLMDASVPDLLEEICDLLEAHRKDVWIDIHRLRAWRSGKRVHADFHLILPRTMPLEQGHHEVKELERIFDRHFQGMAEILIHLDPCADPECPVCKQEPCEFRKEENRVHRKWRSQELTCAGESDEIWPKT